MQWGRGLVVQCRQLCGTSCRVPGRWILHNQLSDSACRSASRRGSVHVVHRGQEHCRLQVLILGSNEETGRLRVIWKREVVVKTLGRLSRCNVTTTAPTSASEPQHGRQDAQTCSCRQAQGGHRQTADACASRQPPARITFHEVFSKTAPQ
jgi:hypothetical protein